MPRISDLVSILRDPVAPDTRRELRAKWDSLPLSLRTARQMYGRQGGGCGATIGVMPRCDFACRGCYLTDGANQAAPLPLDAVQAQIRRLRAALGNAGDLQLTDGEVTLRPTDELLAIIRYARDVGLIPMLMTHGDSFRRRPGLLERLMREGGLTEISVHVDTTQRGRSGAAYKHAVREDTLDPLRDELATIVRRARATTGLPLRCATTMTVTRGNLDGVATVVRWAARNADVVHVVSFQPAAQVGRTEDGMGGGVAVDALWTRIADALFHDPAHRAEYLASHVHFGHPACNRVVPGLVVRRAGEPAHYVPLRRDGVTEDEAAVDAFFRRFGGITFRRDTTLERLTRAVAVVAREPRFIARELRRYAWSLGRRLEPAGRVRLAGDLLRGRTTIHSLMVMSHHFMSLAETKTEEGRERLGACVFWVPVDGAVVPMCSVNTTGIRQAVYAQ